MPIKFRCKHCKQFLGISRQKAGEVVDCPTCGRTIRVPGLDGQVAPLKMDRPDINLKDPSLDRALDELVSLGDISEIGTLPARASADPHRQSHLESHPKSTAEPVDSDVMTVEPVGQPVPIELEPLAEPEVVDPPEIGPPVSVQPRRSAEVTAPVDEQDDIQTMAVDRLALRNLKTVSAVDPAPVNDGPAGIRTVRNRALIAGGLLTLILLAISMVNRSEDPAEPPEQALGDSGAILGDDQSVDTAGATVGTPFASIYGTIQYADSSQTLHADRGARVILLPMDEGRTPATSLRLDATGTRAAEDSVEFRMTEAALDAAGGKLLVTDEFGQFQATLQAGNYRVVAISNSVAAAEDFEIDESLENDWLSFFGRSNPVLFRLRTASAQILISDESATEWNQRFVEAN